MTIIICDGCKRELKVGLDRIYPQKRENYCSICQKHFSDFDLDRNKMYFSFDQEKKALIDKLRIKHFGHPIDNSVEQTPADMILDTRIPDQQGNGPRVGRLVDMTPVNQAARDLMPGEGPTDQLENETRGVTRP